MSEQVNCEAMRIAALNSQQNWQIRIAVGILAIFIFALVGPYSTYDQFSVGKRFLYWGALIGSSLLPAYWISRALNSAVSGSALRRDVISVLGVGLALAPVIWWVNRMVLGDSLARLGALVEHVILVWLICAVPVLVRHYVRTSTLDVRTSRIATEPGDGSDVPLLRHLEPNLRGEVRRVSANDRQAIIHTDKGEASLRMRFTDALIQLEGASGMRVHRSHWLAFEHIECIEQDGRRYVARLVCGATVPVSPAYVDGLTSAGIALMRD